MRILVMSYIKGLIRVVDNTGSSWYPRKSNITLKGKASVVKNRFVRIAF